MLGVSFVKIKTCDATLPVSFTARASRSIKTFRGVALREQISIHRGRNNLFCP